jgi:predicted ATPase
VTNTRSPRRESILRAAERPLADHPRPLTGTSRLLAAESFFNVATTVDSLDVTDSYGGRSLHEQSHGESFMALALHRFGPKGLYILDEPEAALSPLRQMSMLRRVHDLARQGCQFIVATHAPIVLWYPGAWIYELGEHGLRRVEYDETSTVQVTRQFLGGRATMLEELLADDAVDADD